MNLEYQMILILNQVPGIKSGDRLHCRKSCWFGDCFASAPWVFNNDNGSADDCANNCANNCANVLYNDDTNNRVFRGAVFGSLGAAASGPCVANKIKIKWTDATEEDIAANNAGMCTYGGDIRTPIRAATKPGKTFIGWKFSKKAE